MNNNLLIENIYYRQNKNIKEYIDVFFETNTGILNINTGSLYYTGDFGSEPVKRLEGLDKLKEIYSQLRIDEVRKTGDNNIYFLISGKFLLAIEYSLNTYSKYSVQDFRIIEDIQDTNKTELTSFKKLDIVELPLL